MFKRLSLLLLVGSSSLIACTDKFEELNTDPNRIEKISPGTLLNPIIYSLASFNTLRSADFTFPIMQVALPFPSGSGGIQRYDVTETEGNSTWDTYYRWLGNIKEMRAAAVAANDPNYEAIALTLNAWIYSQLTDCFGDVPMDEASRGEEGIFAPAFNTQPEIYAKILADLERANDLFNPAKPLNYGTDLLYGNSIAGWQRFCNSLHLRLLLRVSKRPEIGAPTLLAAIINNPTKYPVFTQNSDAAILKITGVAPNLSPYGRAIDFTSNRAAAQYFIDNLNTLADPRLPKFATQARSSNGTTLIGYRGIPSAYTGSDAQFMYQPSNLSIALVTAPTVSVIMTYAEVEFIKAEAALKGYTTGDAKAAYDKGVRAAIEQWGGVLSATYLQAPSAGAYNGTLARIMLQKYYALFFNDYQQWFEYRRTGLPVLPKGPGLLNNGVMPVRFRYPTSVQISNSANYQKAVTAMGGDNINTKVWWEK